MHTWFSHKGECNLVLAQCMLCGKQLVGIRFHTLGNPKPRTFPLDIVHCKLVLHIGLRKQHIQSVRSSFGIWVERTLDDIWLGKLDRHKAICIEDGTVLLFELQ